MSYVAERTDHELLEEANQRNQAQEEVLQQYLKEIRELQAKAKKYDDLERGAKKLLTTNKLLTAELDMYQALVKGWPKGRKLVKLMTRARDY